MSVDEPEARIRATDAALAGLRALLVEGSLQPGDRLPSEPELSARLGVSRGSLREAVRTLVTLGVLEARRGDGTYVTEMRPGTMLRSFAWAVDLVPLDGIVELNEIRRALDAHAAGLAAARISDEVLAEVGALLEQMRAESDPRELGRLDHRFHEVINAACGNETLAEIIQIFRHRGDRLDMYRLMPLDEARDISWLGHRAIYEALCRHDPQAAAAAAAAHTLQSETWIRDLREAGRL